MSFRDKLDAQRLLNGAMIAAAIGIAWAIERRKPAAAAVESCPSGWAGADVPPSPPSIWRMPWSWWRTVLFDVYDAINRNRLLAVAAGVVFYGLLSLFPAITAFVSSYGLFANPANVQKDLSMLASVLPPGGISIIEEQIVRIVARPSGLGIGFIMGLLIALWSANAGVKAMIDALNVIMGREERRGVGRLNLVSLSLTIGAIAFLLLAIGAVVAFPLVMSTFGLKPYTATATWLMRWPVLLALMIVALAVFYRFGPGHDGTQRLAWLTPGTVTAALLWLAGSAALSFYLSNFADYNATYGSLGAAIGLMMWMWLSSVVVLLGAQLDTVIARKRGSPTAV